MSSGDDKLHVCCYFGPDRCRRVRCRSQPALQRRSPPPHTPSAPNGPAATCGDPCSSPQCQPGGPSPSYWVLRAARNSTRVLYGRWFARGEDPPPPLPPTPLLLPATRIAIWLSRARVLLAGLCIQLLSGDSLPIAQPQPTAQRRPMAQPQSYRHRATGAPNPL